MKYIIRHRARECIVQALYSWQLSNNNILDIERYFLVERKIKNIDINYFHELLFGIIHNKEKLDSLIKPYLFRVFNYIDHIERAILRIAVFEMYNRKDVPYKVIINEAIELAKSFGAEGSYKFINGVLSKAIFSNQKLEENFSINKLSSKFH